MSASSVFPLEIYDLVIDKLKYERKVLQACLFVSRSFRHRARHNLFSRVSINDEVLYGNGFWRDPTPEGTHRRLQLLVDIMRPPTSAPGDPYPQGIIHYIQEFTFSFASDPGFYSINPPSEGLRQSQARTVEIFQILRAACPGSPLRSIGLHTDGDDEGDWMTLAPEIRSSLIQLIRAVPTLDLEFTFIINIPRNILRGTMVKNITLLYVDIFDPTPDDDDPDDDIDLELYPEYNEESGIALLPLPALQSADVRLNLDLFSAMLNLSNAAVSPSSIKDLRLDLENFVYIGTLNRLSKEFPNLEVLSIWTEGEDYDSPICQFGIRNLESLKRLEFHFTTSLEDNFFEAAMPLLLPIILPTITFCSNPKVTSIRVAFPIMSFATNEEERYDFDLSHFGDIDALLGSPSNFPSLETCTVELHVQPHVDLPLNIRDQRPAERTLVLEPFVRRGFPKLESSRVTFVLEIYWKF